MPHKVKPIAADEGLTANELFTLVPSLLEPSALYGTVTATCTICRKRMHPLALARPDEPTTKLSVRMWAERRWLQLPLGRGTFCPAHLPRFEFWHDSFDFTLKPWPAPPTPTFTKPQHDQPFAQNEQDGIF